MTKECYPYWAECNINNFYDKEDRSKCYLHHECYKKWFELGGILGWDGIRKFGEKHIFEEK